MKFLAQLEKWHDTKAGLLAVGLIELVLAYVFISLALDKGNLWYYLLTLIFLVGSLQHFVRFGAKLFRRNKLRDSKGVKRARS